jgi:ADP-ribose pyrophosphatase
MDQKTLRTETIYNGLIFDLERHTVRLPNGKEARRDIIRHNGASAIIPVTDDGGVILVRQYREGAGGFLLELPAGKLEPGEDPAVCAVRELAEETGHTAETMRFLTSLRPVAAYSTEVIHFYVAEGLKPGLAHPDTDEFVTLETYKLDEILRMIGEGSVMDMKTVAGVLLYARRKLGGMK